MTTKTATKAASMPKATSKPKTKAQTAAAAKTKPAIFIDGEAGTTGLGDPRRVADVAGLEVKSIAPEKRKDAAARLAMMRAVDLVVLCLPDEAARQGRGADRRTGQGCPKGDRRQHGAPRCPRLGVRLPRDGCGQTEAVRKARRVSNPGCYPTAAIALIRPLVEAGLLPADYPVTINAVSGYSGGGRSMIEAYEVGTAPAFELYGLGFEHKHLPELQHYSGLTRRPIFVPSVGNFPPGDACERAPAPRHAARQANRARPRGGAGQTLRRR